MRRLLFLLILSLCALPVAAQWSFGPQIGGLGVGGSVTKKTFFRFLSVSGEFGFAPVGTTNVDFEGNRYTLEPTVSGGLAMASLHPFRSNFALSAGYLIGGYEALAATPEDEGAYVIDGMTYTADQYGKLSGRFELSGPVPALMVGWRGAGFNFGVGVALTEPLVELSADGPRASEAEFQAALERERVDLEEALQLELFGLQGVPLIRLGWELGL
ncbi:MAG: hypothetical protein JJ896_08645 [Rhodothermales bacterium]|nr:hypothetical protein [Rhodothermales bacterium]MBO6779706.1 hypothetical protein [Rhodothermales bacterium]